MDSKEASDVFSATHHKAERGEKSLVEQWDVFKEQAKQEKTAYSVRTAFRDVADVHVAVRLGWPHLSKNAATYESEMEETFRALLSSLTGELGNYERRPGEFFSAASIDVQLNDRRSFLKTNLFGATGFASGSLRARLRQMNG